MSVWASISDMFMPGEGVATTAAVKSGVMDSPEVTQALSEVGMVDMASSNSGVIGSMSSPTSLKIVGGDKNSWTGKILAPAMQQIMGTAMKPQVAPRSAAGGHGVQANAATAAKVPETILKMATTGEPLANIQSFSRLFE
ncbi:hypothetical protein [Buttiauxella brennerae]|uniref:hypothetical protein n=1 Tax=Buttiauxella brennerae TaxID=82988 RepID=UPI00286ED8B1|nr:hypothetical protein [Buttiauxella brennerae]